MLGLRSGAGHAPSAHHGIDLSALGDRDAMRQAMNPARAAREAASAEAPQAWTPPVLRTVAAQGDGVAEVVDALDRHYRYLASSGELQQRRRQRLRERVMEVVDSKGNAGGMPTRCRGWKRNCRAWRPGTWPRSRWLTRCARGAVRYSRAPCTCPRRGSYRKPIDDDSSRT
jgi:hypothetical protein